MIEKTEVISMIKKHFKIYLINLIILISLFMTNIFAQSGSPERIIKLDFNQIKGTFNTMFKECVGAGRANEGLRADWQQQLAYVKERMWFQIYPHARTVN